ncbi:hypothetical protein RN001_015397 [Aquatica leii]|uniref:Uncharacterized protein n=1 Tax=Aquatica leii TaxID=1421715 RepID=A0AAN7P1R7_9COLE|nr:hypothetical protein RN001_015397 [Aquatica leii]
MYSLAVVFGFLNLVLLEASYLDTRASLFLPFASECICATGVDPKKAHDYIFNLKYTDDPCLKCFVKCSTTKIGYFTSDGKHQDSATRKNIPEATQQFITTCTNITSIYTDLCEKMFEYSRCMVNFLLKLENV